MDMCGCGCVYMCAIEKEETDVYYSVNIANTDVIGTQVHVMSLSHQTVVLRFFFSLISV